MTNMRKTSSYIYIYAIFIMLCCLFMINTASLQHVKKISQRDAVSALLSSPFEHNLSATREECQECKGLVDIIMKKYNSGGKIDDIIDAYTQYCEEQTSSSSKECIQLAELVIPKMNDIATKYREYQWDSEPVCASYYNKCDIECCSDDTYPNQVMMFLGPDDTRNNLKTSRYFTWVTLTDTTQYNPRIVIGHTKDFSDTTEYNAIVTPYKLGGWVGYINTVYVDKLNAGNTYYYKVGIPAMWSQNYSFKTFEYATSSSSSRPLRVLHLSGLDIEGFDTIMFLSTVLKQPENIHFVLWNGDIGLVDGSERRSDHIFQVMSKLFTLNGIPLLVAAGKHDGHEWFMKRFPRANRSPDELYSSYTFNGIHFQTLYADSTSSSTPAISSQQVKWIHNDLLPDSSIYWRITALPRPLYCTSNGDDGNMCGSHAESLRKQIEQELINGRVDIVLHGTENAYERTAQIKNDNIAGSPDRSSKPDVYSRNKAPVYVIHGNNGNRITQPDEPKNNKKWSVVASKTISIGIMSIDRYSFTYEAFMSDDSHDSIDAFIIK